MHAVDAKHYIYIYVGLYTTVHGNTPVSKQKRTHGILSQCSFNVDPPSATPAQH